MGQAPRGASGEGRTKETILFLDRSHYYHYCGRILKDSMEGITQNSSNPRFLTPYLKFSWDPDSNGMDEPFTIRANTDCTIEYWAAGQDVGYIHKKAKYTANELVYSKNSYTVNKICGFLLKVT